MKKTIDPFWWGFFGAGGAISALVMPILLFLTGLAIPLGLIQNPGYDRLASLIQNPLTRLFLMAVISLSLLHWAHRFRFTLYDGLQIKHLNELIAILCYGTALLGTAVAAYVLWSF